MVRGIPRKIVIIRDIPSNMIEEAILILKNETDDKGVVTPQKKGAVQAGNSLPDDRLLKEAEAIINNYIRENNLYTIRDRRMAASKRSIVRGDIVSWVTGKLILAACAAALLLLIIRLL